MTGSCYLSHLRIRVKEDLIRDIVEQHKDAFPVVFGMSRSGSTLLRNIMNTIFHGNIGIQKSSYTSSDHFRERPIVGVYRDFRDATASKWRVSHGKFHKEEDKVVADWHVSSSKGCRNYGAKPKLNGILDMSGLPMYGTPGHDSPHLNVHHPSCSNMKCYAFQIRHSVHNDLNQIVSDIPPSRLLLLKYEDFHDNYDYLFDKLEPFLDITILPELRDFIKTAWSKDRVRRDYSDPLENFERWDHETHFHGSHIYKGTHGSWRELLNESDHSKMNDYFRSDLSQWGYSI